jgi:hypothetical protein
VQQIKKVKCSGQVMHSTKREKNSGAEKSGVSGPGPECPENLDTPEESPDSPGFSTAAEKQTTHSFSI